ncbi:relaxase/mobilization nuclease domain-containing protein, partial [Bacillus cereus]
NRLLPYYDKEDRPRLNAWKDLLNHHNTQHDPNDPLNKRELCTPNNLPRAKIKACEAITSGLLSVAGRGEIGSRDDVIKTLEQAGFEIARTTKKTISIKDPDGGQNIRLKGAIYEQDFRFSKELRADIERASKEYRENRGQR